MTSQVKKKVAVSMRVSNPTEYHDPRDVISQDWIRFLEYFDLNFVLVPNVLKEPDAFLVSAEVDLILLTNGNDVGSCPERELTEKALLEFAIKHSLPVLGVCRGMQFINCFFGGTLTKDLKSTDEEHVAVDHEVEISDEAIRRNLKLEKIITNSYHNQGVMSSTISNKLVHFAQTKAGVVEGLYHPDLPILAVQWHPERSLLDNQVTLQLVDAWKRGFQWHN